MLGGCFTRLKGIIPFQIAYTIVVLLMFADDNFVSEIYINDDF